MHDGIVIDLFCWKTSDLLELINCYCLDATFVVVVVNSWIVASFNLLCFCVWVGVRGVFAFGFDFFLSFFLSFLVFVYLCMRACVCVCVFVCAMTCSCL